MPPHPGRPAAITFLVLFTAAGFTASRAPHTPPPPLTPADLPPRAAVALPPGAALNTFKLAPGFAATLAASEPVIQAPVMAVFDEDGRLWVVEMRSFMPDFKGTGELLPTNRISILEDKDGDGTFESSTVFLDNLVLPRAVAPCYGGALVLEPPSLYFCKDTDGDGRADTKQKLLDGFGGLESPEHAANGLLRGLDNWHHFSQHGLEVRFDGEKLITRPTPNHGQWGLTQDDGGRLYYTPNSSPLLIDVFPKHYAVGMPGSVAGMGDLIGKDASTWPAHTTLGVNRGYMPNILREDGTLANLTAACGQSLYRASLLGPEFRGNAFICEPAGNLVKRLVLNEKDGLPDAVNAYQGAEFFTSTDERFRPVWSLTGPDGALYLCDMYRGVIQHKLFLTEYLEKQARSRGLQSPINMGRIWRVAPDGFTPAPFPRLSKATDGELVALLSHADAWYRETAQRLLVERRATAIADQLRGLLRTSTNPVARLHALWTLEGLGTLTQDDLIVALADASPLVQTGAIHASAELSPGSVSPALRTAWERLRASPDRMVRVQWAVAMPRFAPDPSGVLAGVLADGSNDKYIRAAALCAARGQEITLLAKLLEDKKWPRNGGDNTMLRDLAQNIVRSGPASRRELVELTGALANSSDPRAAKLVGAVADFGRLEGDRAKPLPIGAEPTLWLAASQGDSSLAQRMAACAEYFEWPNRPPAKRASRLAPLLPHEQDLFDRGKALYATCAACHQPSGQGSPGQGAILAGSKRVNGRPEPLVKILINGMEGEYPWGDITYRGSMPAAEISNDTDLAAVLTYIRREWENSGDPVSPELVGRVRAENRDRKKAWTGAELDGLAPPK